MFFSEEKNQRTLKRRTSFSVQTFALQGIKHRLCRTWKEMRACEAFTFVQTTKCVCTGIVQPRRSLGRKGAFGRCESKIVRKSVAHICASYTQVTDLDLCSIKLCGTVIFTFSRSRNLYLTSFDDKLRKDELLGRCEARGLCLLMGNSAKMKLS